MLQLKDEKYQRLAERLKSRGYLVFYLLFRTQNKSMMLSKTPTNMKYKLQSEFKIGDKVIKILDHSTRKIVNQTFE